MIHAFTRSALDQAVDYVSELYGVDKDIFFKKYYGPRPESCRYARQAFVFLANFCMGLSQKDIADYMGCFSEGAVASLMFKFRQNQIENSELLEKLLDPQVSA